MSYTRTFSSNHQFVAKVVRGAFQSTRHQQVTYKGTRSGTKVQDYKEKIRNGENAASVYNLDRYELKGNEPGHASFSAVYTGYLPPNQVGDTRSETWTGIEIIPSASLAHRPTSVIEADAIALAKIYKKIREEQQHMNSPAIVAEFVDVIRQFGSPARSIVDLTNRHLNRLALERRGLKGSTSFKRIKWHEIVASTYLEWSFGLRPLISDTQSAAEALAKWQYEKNHPVHFRKAIRSRGVNKAVYKDTGVPTQPWKASWIYVNNVTDWQTECRVQYNVGLSTTPIAAFGSNERLLQILGFNPSNWVPALWEAVPWSWLIDYFTNVQQILEAAATVTTGVKWISKTVTYRTDYRHTREVNDAASRQTTAAHGYSGGATGHCGRMHLVRTTMARSIPATLGVPALTLEYPQKVGQLANMVAVLLARKPSSSALWLF